MPLKIAIFRSSIKYFFNASAADKIKGNEEVKKLLSYISTNVPENAFTKEIEEEVEASSNDAEWRKGLMTFEMLMEEKFEDGIEKGIEKGAYNNKLETAKKLLEDNIPSEAVVKYTGLPLKVIIELKDRA